MKNTIKSLLWLFLLFSRKITLAADWWIFWDYWNELKNWDIHVSDIAPMIKNIIQFLMWTVWLVAIIFIIIWAYQVLFWGLSDSRQQWMKTVASALTWLALAILSWFIVKLLFDNLI